MVSGSGAVRRRSVRLAEWSARASTAKQLVAIDAIAIAVAVATAYLARALAASPHELDSGHAMLLAKACAAALAAGLGALAAAGMYEARGPSRNWASIAASLTAAAVAVGVLGALTAGSSAPRLVLLPCCLLSIVCVGAARAIYWGRRRVHEPGCEGHPRVARLLDGIGSRCARRCETLDAAVAHARLAFILMSGLYVGAFTYHAAYSVQTKGFLIMPDELQYLKLADSIGHGLLPEVRGAFFGSYNNLYPALIAPLTWLFPSVPDAFVAIHVFNSLAMASVVFPTFLLTRSIVRSRLAALIAGALAVTGPWLLFTNLIMTESVSYPVFMWAVLGIQRALVEPSRRRDAAALLGIGIAVFARTQFVVLVPTMVGAMLLHRATYAATVAEPGSRASAFKLGLSEAARLHYTALVSASIVVAAGLIAVVWSAQSVLGVYGAVMDPPRLVPPGLVIHMARHLMQISVALAFLPVVLSLAFVATALRRPESRPTHAYALLLSLTVFAVLLQSSWFNLSFAHGNLNDRYLFYVAGPLSVGMTVALTSTMTSWRAVAIAASVMAGLVPVGTYGPTSNWFGAPSLSFVQALDDSLAAVNDRLRFDIGVELVLIIAALALGGLAVALIRAARRPVALVVLTLPVMMIGALEGQYLYATSGWRTPSPKVLAESLSIRDPGNGNWIDEHVTGGRSVALISSPTLGFIPPWRDEFWNEAVDKVYRLGTRGRSATEEGILGLHPRAFDHHEIRIDERTGAVRGIGRIDMSRFVVMSARETRFSLSRAQRVASHRGPARMSDSSRRDLLRVSVPYRAAWHLRNLPGDAWTTRTVTELLIFPGARRAERRQVAITFDGGKEIGRARSWSVRGSDVLESGRLTPGGAKQTTRFSVCISPAEPTLIRIRITPNTQRARSTRRGLMVRNLRVSGRGHACAVKRRATRS